MTSHQEASGGTRSVETDGRTYDLQEYASPTTGVAEAVAAETGRSPTELAPLQESVDADALDKLLGGSEDSRVQVSFTYEGLNVLVTDTTVEVWQ